jgi:hypothetical protein
LTREIVLEDPNRSLPASGYPFQSANKKMIDASIAMPTSFELICHHVYAGCDGLPLDLSDHDNHGQAIDTEFLKNGVTPYSGARRF